MSRKSKKLIVKSQEIIQQKIFLVRGIRVMLDKDLARLYGVETRTLNQAVKRNRSRFPSDFMFQVNKKEFDNLRSQIVTSSWGGQRYAPYVFTEQGVAMLSSVLKSERAIQVNIQIMRTFTKIRELLSTNRGLREKVEKMEKKFDQQFRVVFEVIQRLLQEEEKPKRKIGFLNKK